MSSHATITVEELKARLDAGEKLNLIDVREPEEVIHGMIPGAVHLRMGEIPARLDEIPRDEEVIFICRSSHRSDQVCQYLSSLGYKGITNMLGGMMAWVQLPE